MKLSLFSLRKWMLLLGSLLIIGPAWADVSELNEQVAQLYERGQYPQAIVVAQQALSEAEGTGATTSTIITCVSNLALMYRSAERYEEALPLYQRALALSEVEAGPEHPDTAERASRLGRLYKLMGRYDDALTLFQRALDIDEKALGPGHADTVQDLSYLAGAYRSKEQYSEALWRYRKVLDLREQATQPDDEALSVSVYNVAGVLRAMGNYNEALPLYQRSLAIQEKISGPNDPQTATAINNLAGLYEAQGRYAEALPLYQRALSIDERALGADHPDTGVDLNNQAGLLRKMGRYNEALPLFLRALTIVEEKKGREDSYTATVLNNLAGLYKTLGRYGEALPLYRRALDIDEKTLGLNHHGTAIDLNNLGMLYKLMGNNDEALRLYQRAWTIEEKIFGADHPELAVNLNNLAEIYEEQGNLGDALALYRRALAIREKSLAPDHVSIALSLNNLAGMYQSMGRYTEALPLYQRALEIDEKSLGPEHPSTATAINNLAVLYESMGRGDEVLPLLRRAVHIVAVTDISDPGRDHGAIGSLATFSANLANSLKRLDTPGAQDEAIFYYKLSVNARQRMRAGTRGMDAATRESFTRQLSAPYRSLSVLLVQRGRIAEAERVLLLLKESELTAYLRRNGADGVEQQGLLWTEAEEAYRKNLEVAAARWREYAQRYREVMEGVKQGIFTDPGPETLALVRLRVQIETQTGNIMDDAMQRLGAAAEKASQQQKTAFEKARTKLSSKLAGMGARNGGLRTAGLVLQPTERGLLIIVTTGQGAVPLISPVSEDRLGILVKSLREAIQGRKDYRKPARELHRLLIEPAEKQLNGANDIQQWAILPFGNLRALPYAALIGPDGRHLIERYAVTMLTADGGGGLDGLETHGSDIWHGVAFGASQANADFGNIPLPGVREEVCGVIREAGSQSCLAAQGIISGRRYIDDAFTSDMLQYWLAAGSSGAEVLHIATHYKVEQSQLLLGDGSKLSTGELLGWNPKLEQYDMIVLSACDSGISDGAVESLAGVFRSQGAKTVMATLWPVADVGATPMMLEFYRQRGETRVMSKAAALRKTQIAMIDGKINGGGAAIDLRHPYFWASYVLMGNWL
ncbi:tetratricopeptide repeat protein [Duganella radicis]|uniref:Tetratricopeptide repeat protein n=1 Tax=Duganella radicis TaxID=551988 RepID=A0A6L6PBU8_9BURK|nr:tetratricopeptide repeat protein [Duganella radicis]MTV36576.1 tetratricopeptide repeat protein [Duganella radicis]